MAVFLLYSYLHGSNNKMRYYESLKNTTINIVVFIYICFIDIQLFQGL